MRYQPFRRVPMVDALLATLRRPEERWDAWEDDYFGEPLVSIRLVAPGPAEGQPGFWMRGMLGSSYKTMIALGPIAVANMVRLQADQLRLDLDHEIEKVARLCGPLIRLGFGIRSA